MTNSSIKHRFCSLALFALYGLSMATSANAQEKASTDKLPGIAIAPKVPQLEFFYEARVKLGELSTVGVYNGYERGVLELVGGTFEGPKIRGKVLPTNRDWPVWYGNGVRQTDVAYVFQTEDGVHLFVTAEGYRYDPAAMKGVSKAAEPVDSNRLRVFIRIQAPDNSPYAWVNHNLFVGVAGASGADRTATLRVYRIL